MSLLFYYCEIYMAFKNIPFQILITVPQVSLLYFVDMGQPQCKSLTTYHLAVILNPNPINPIKRKAANNIIAF